MGPIRDRCAPVVPRAAERRQGSGGLGAAPEAPRTGRVGRQRQLAAIPEARISPARVIDTRSTGAVSGGGDVSLAILGKGGLPASGVAAVVVNTTVTDTKAAGYLTVFPDTNPLPTASNLNWSAPGTTIPNLVTVQVDSNGSIKFHNGSGGTTQVVADTAGYYIGT